MLRGAVEARAPGIMAGREQLPAVPETIISPKAPKAPNWVRMPRACRFPNADVRFELVVPVAVQGTGSNWENGKISTGSN